MKRV
jgi:hypothetical protein